MSAAAHTTTVATHITTAHTATSTPIHLSKHTLFKPIPKTQPNTTLTHKNPPPRSFKNPLSQHISSFESHPDDQNQNLDEDDDKPREECGVVGIYGDPEASRLCYLALHALQHRGQEGAGIVTACDGILKSVTGVGLVSEVFNQSKLDQLPGDNAIGHVRYSTAGQSMLKNVQPFVAGYRFGRVGVAHNGNLVNYQSLRAELEENGSIFGTSSDTEVVLHLIAISKQRPFFQRIVEACEKLKGAYSMVFITEDKLVAVRDPYGFRPLVMGRRKNGAIVFASETCALDLIEAEYEREVNPGEVLFRMIFSGRSRAHMAAVSTAYHSMYGNTLKKAVKSETSGNFEHALVTIIQCAENPGKYFAKVLHKAMKGLGTNDKTLIRVIVTRAEIDMQYIKAEYHKKHHKSLNDQVHSETSGHYRTFLLSLLGPNQH